jgi:hypothetical protein
MGPTLAALGALVYARVVGVSATATAIVSPAGREAPRSGDPFGGLWSRALGCSQMGEKIRCGEHPLREGLQNVEHARAKRVEASKEEKRERELKDERENARPEEHDRIFDAGDAVHAWESSEGIPTR